MKKILIASLIIVMVFAMTACGGGSASSGTTGNGTAGADSGESGDDVLTVGFIYIGAVNDGGYTQAQHNGTLAVQEYFKGAVQCIWEENIEDTNAQATQDAAARLKDLGATVIIGTSFGFGEPLYALADSDGYKDITFLHFSGGNINETNFGNYFGAMEEPRYLTGIIAGLQTKTNKLGYVAAYPYTEVKIGINAFTLGAQSVNPATTVNVVYTNSWYDPAGEKAAAEALLDQGCDVITQHADTATPQLAAADAGAFAIGYNLDNSAIEGLEDAFLTAPVWHHDVYLIPAIQAIIDGTWKPEAYYGTMADGYVDLAPLTKNVSDEAKAKVGEISGKIKAGAFPIFVGPIKDNAGNEVVPEGTTLDHAGIWSMEYLVEGVSASE
ncbi:MAG: BMP family ABC transporter substrate-binding protein [Clostridiales Family XIII bacterium]|jgi:basic membrane protein A|nr:BMP family ABC transporter substrate-binding protein [Clostridiales Family XIII bacterium]